MHEILYSVSKTEPAPIQEMPRHDDTDRVDDIRTMHTQSHLFAAISPCDASPVQQEPLLVMFESDVTNRSHAPRASDQDCKRQPNFSGYVP